MHIASLPVTGTYTIVLDIVSSGGTDTFTLTLSEDLPPVPITIDGAPVVLTVARRAQRTPLTFTGTAGQRLSLGLGATTMASKVTILKPDGATQIQQGTNTVTLAYDNAGRRTNLTLPNGVTTTSTYDASSRLTGLSYTHGATTLGTLTYAYNSNGERTVVGGTWARTGIPAAVTGATYNASNQQVAFNGQTLTFDLNGNLTSDGTTTYTWNARNQLVGMSRSGLTAGFAYDGTGRRQSTTLNGTAMTFLYDGLNAVKTTDPGGSILLLSGLGLDAHLLRTDGAGSVSLLTDALGSTVALADATGATTTSYTYDPFGTTTTAGASSANRSQYTGRENDGTGLYYYRARYYHPQLPRFISEDPIGFAGGDVNLYAYVFNAPMTFLDSLGLRIDLSMSSPELNRALELVKRTKRGRELYDAMERDSRTCQIVSLRGFQNAVRIRGTCNIVIDPDFHPEIPTLAGRKSAPTARILAHEMGHAATNVTIEAKGDTGPGQMDNIILNENPVVTELGLSPRTGYTVPSWWYLPFIGYPAPSGVEVPRR
jgi:RHS repeat-associated protein